MKYEVHLTMKVHTFITLEAEDETGAAQTLITTKADLLKLAADNLDSAVEEMEMEIYPEELTHYSMDDSRVRQKQFVKFSNKQVSEMIDHLFASMSEEEKDRHTVIRPWQK